MTTNLNALHFTGTDFIVDESDLSGDLALALKDCGRPGPADEAVAYVRKHFAITGDVKTCQDMLKGYGAWDDTELEDHELNLDRLVWLTGCALAEGEEAYFSTY
jgi:hypothetical protein